MCGVVPLCCLGIEACLTNRLVRYFYLQAIRNRDALSHVSSTITHTMMKKKNHSLSVIVIAIVLPFDGCVCAYVGVAGIKFLCKTSNLGRLSGEQASIRLTAAHIDTFSVRVQTITSTTPPVNRQKFGGG